MYVCIECRWFVSNKKVSRVVLVRSRPHDKSKECKRLFPGCPARHSFPCQQNLFFHNETLNTLNTLNILLPLPLSLTLILILLTKEEFSHLSYRELTTGSFLRVLYYASIRECKAGTFIFLMFKPMFGCCVLKRLSFCRNFNIHYFKKQWSNDSVIATEMNIIIRYDNCIFHLNREILPTSSIN